MLSNAYFLANIRFDTAENEPAKNLQNNLSAQETALGSERLEPDHARMNASVIGQLFVLLNLAHLAGALPQLCGFIAFIWLAVAYLPTYLLLLSRLAKIVRNCIWVANKRFEISKFKFQFPRARTYEIRLILGCIEAKFFK